MKRGWILVIFMSALRPLNAARCQAPDPAYEQLVAHHNYTDALARLLQDAKIPESEKGHFIVDPTLGQRAPGVHGQSDPDTQQAMIDPELFDEGETGACEAVLHEAEHLDQFAFDRAQLEAYYRRAPLRKDQWAGCDEFPQNSRERVGNAYDCLEDNDLTPHAAAAEIAAVLAQLSTPSTLRDEDKEYLVDAVRRFEKTESVLRDSSNEGYYLPTIKAHDERVFRQGALYLRGTNAD